MLGVFAGEWLIKGAQYIEVLKASSDREYLDRGLFWWGCRS
jgi:hypothetical protein